MRHSTCQFVATSVIWVLALFGTGGVPHSADAALIVFNSRPAFDALGQVTSVDWGVFDAGGTGISTPAFETVGPLTVGVHSTQGVLARKDEGTQFIGDFAVGDHLLTDGGSESDSFIVSFGAPVVGFGTQIEPDYIRGAFTGDIKVFSPTGVLLGDIPISGNATNAEDNSAPFYGIVSSIADIGFAEFLVDQQLPLLPAGAVAINTMDVLMDVLVPEPSSLALLATAIFGIIGFRRARYQLL
jgi:hypothetical protein